MRNMHAKLVLMLLSYLHGGLLIASDLEWNKNVFSDESNAKIMKVFFGVKDSNSAKSISKNIKYKRIPAGEYSEYRKAADLKKEEILNLSHEKQENIIRKAENYKNYLEYARLNQRRYRAELKHSVELVKSGISHLSEKEQAKILHNAKQHERSEEYGKLKKIQARENKKKFEI